MPRPEAVTASWSAVEALGRPSAASPGLELESATAAFREDKVVEYMHFLLMGLCEFHARLGHVPARKWLHRLVLGAQSAGAWRKRRRCTVWAMLDTTSLYMTKQYVRRLDQARALHTIVIACVCCNHWRPLQLLYGDEGVPLPTTAGQFARAHAEARRRHAQIPTAPVGGLIGSSRSTLAKLADKLLVAQQSGRNPEQFMYFLTCMYAEHVSDVVASMAQKLQTLSVADMDPILKNQEVSSLLQEHFFLFGLCKEQVSRYVGQIFPGAYFSELSDFVGENAARGLASLLPPDAAPKSLQAAPYRQLLRALATRVQQRLPLYAASVLPATAWQYLSSRGLPGVGTFEHRQLHEHNCCEFAKACNGAEGLPAYNPSDVPYAQSCSDAHPGYFQTSV